MKKVKKQPVENSPTESHGVHYYKKRIRSSLLLFVEDEILFLFDYAGSMYVTIPEQNLIFYRYDEKMDPPFVKANEFDDSMNFDEALLDKYYSRLESGMPTESLDPREYLDCYDGIEDTGFALPKKQLQFLKLVVAIDSGALSEELTALSGND